MLNEDYDEKHFSIIKKIRNAAVSLLMLHTGAQAIAVASASSTSAPNTQSDFLLHPSFPILPQGYWLVRTDGRALGKISNPDCVVVWNHGRTQGGEDWSASIMPFYTNKLKDLGCDMYRLNRLSAFDNPPALSANALANVANKLHGAGYEKVILAGQSWGALISVIAAGISRNVYAVIATAPAAFGPRTNNPNDGWPQNSSVLYSYLWATNPQTRMFLFFPKDDAFDPLDGRGKNVQDILAQRNIASVVVNYPPNFPGGHNIAVSQNFADRFGICIQDFVQMKNIGVNSQCTQNGLEPKGRVEPPTIASRPPQAEGRIIRVSTPAQ